MLITNGSPLPPDYHYGLSVKAGDVWLPQTSPEAIQLTAGPPRKWFVEDGKFWLNPPSDQQVKLRYVPVGGPWPDITRWMVGCWHAWQYFASHGPQFSRLKAQLFRGRYEWWKRVVEGGWYKTWSGHRMRR